MPRGKSGKVGGGGARGEGQEGDTWEEEGVGGEETEEYKSVILSSDVVNLQDATALGHMQGC